MTAPSAGPSHPDRTAGDAGRSTARRTLRALLATALVATPAAAAVAVPTTDLGRHVSTVVADAEREAVQVALGTAAAADPGDVVLGSAEDRTSREGRVSRSGLRVDLDGERREARQAVQAKRERAEEAQDAQRVYQQAKQEQRKKPEPMTVARPVVVEERPPFVLPVSGYHLTSTFGESGYYWSSGMHTGLDFAGPSGTPVVSVADGVVEAAGYDGAYGNKVEVSLPDGGTVWYCHLDSIAVSPGQQLGAGQQVGTLGSTGNVTGPHLHLEVQQGGEPVDPYAYLAAQGVTP